LFITNCIEKHCTQPLRHDFNFHAYANDIQLASTIVPETESSEIISKVQECLQDRLIDDKTLLEK